MFLVSIVSMLIMAYLLFGELVYHQREVSAACFIRHSYQFAGNVIYSQEVVETLYVNTTRSTALTIDFDLSFPSLSCSVLAVDALDDAGLPIPDAVHELYKHRLGPLGEKQGMPQRQSLGETVRSEEELKKVVAAQGNQVVKVSSYFCSHEMPFTCFFAPIIIGGAS